jgi:uncharacterized protein (TIGR04255 family)
VPLDVSDLDRSLLAIPPLTSVICQIRFDESGGGADARTIQKLRERLGGEAEFPSLDQIAESSVSIAVSGEAPPVAAQQVTAKGWRMQSADGTRSVVLLPASVALEVSRYGGWEVFAGQLDDLLGAVIESVEPVFEQRLGLRYINQIDRFDIHSADGWRGRIEDPFLGPVSNDELGPLVVFSRQQAVLQLDEEETRCTINQGFAPDEARGQALTYVLDFDVFRAGTRPFDRQALNDAAAKFNSYALKLFQAATTSELRSELNR